MRTLAVLLTLFCCVSLVACELDDEFEEGDEDGGGGGSTRTVGASESCATGVHWTGGQSGSSKMLPGQNCISCHKDRGGPRYTAAGTVFLEVNDEDNCFGVSGSTVEITDARGQVVRMNTSKSGNFFTRQSIALPYRARVIHKGEVIEMATAQTDLNCANCHTRQGAGGAPGRIFVP